MPTNILNILKAIPLVLEAVRALRDFFKPKKDCPAKDSDVKDPGR